MTMVMITMMLDLLLSKSPQQALEMGSLNPQREPADAHYAGPPALEISATGAAVGVSGSRSLWGFACRLEKAEDSGEMTMWST